MNKYWGHIELILDDFGLWPIASKSSTSMNSVSRFYTDVCIALNTLIQKQLFRLSQKFVTLN